MGLREARLMASMNPPAINAEAAEDAIKYIIFLADANKLFDVALGMYDFELVLAVAQNSQKVGFPTSWLERLIADMLHSTGPTRVHPLPTRATRPRKVFPAFQNRRPSQALQEGALQPVTGRCVSSDI